MMECKNLPAPRMSGDNIASCVESATRAFTTLITVAGLIYVAIKIGADDIKIKRKDIELEMFKSQDSNFNQQNVSRKCGW